MDKEQTAIERLRQAAELSEFYYQRLLKLACVALHLEFGFGKERLGKFLMKMNGLMGDELLWWHIDKLLIDQVGLEFDREGERE